MKMTNRELVNNLNALNEVMFEEDKLPDDKKMFSGRVHLIMVRNIRAMMKEYNENYIKDLTEIRSKHYDSDEVDGEMKLTLKDGIEQKEADEALNTLLDLEIDVPITKILLEDVEKVPDIGTVEKLNFMVE